MIKGLGLPGGNQMNGDLWIRLELEWPTEAWVASQNLELLSHVLPPVRPDLGPSLPASASQVYARLDAGQFETVSCFLF